MVNVLALRVKAGQTHLRMSLKQSRLDSDKTAGYCRRFPWQNQMRLPSPLLLELGHGKCADPECQARFPSKPANCSQVNGMFILCTGVKPVLMEEGDKRPSCAAIFRAILWATACFYCGSFANSLADRYVRVITRVISVVSRFLAMLTWSVTQGNLVGNLMTGYFS